MKILGSDFDGTLNYGGIDDEKRMALALWREKGNKFGIVSGRGHLSLLELSKSNNLNCDFLVAYNGGMILTPLKEILYCEKCFSVPQKPFIEKLLSYGCTFTHVNNDLYFKIVEESKECTADEYHLNDANAPFADFFYQISVQLKTVEEAEKIVKLIERDFGDKLSPLQNGICIDIIPKGINKATGLLKVAEIFGCEKEDIISVGDNINDLAMIEAFNSYAMENGVDIIKNTAKHITKSVTELIYKEI